MSKSQEISERRGKAVYSEGEKILDWLLELLDKRTERKDFSALKVQFLDRMLIADNSIYNSSFDSSVVFDVIERLAEDREHVAAVHYKSSPEGSYLLINIAFDEGIEDIL